MGNKKQIKNIGIYIHIPFCKRKCKYCDFVSFQNKEDKIDEYITNILNEIECKQKELQEEVQVDTIYIGGGTPSIISELYIEKILNKIFSLYNIIEKPEITIEVNPGTVDEIKLQKYYNIGINRISIGLQSTKKELLNMLGRIHTYNDFEYIYETARKIGFKNINVDLMIGLPNQTIDDVEETIIKIVNKNPEHISVYSLILEENTQLYNLIEENKLTLPDEEAERQMYWKVKNILETNGYNHYEISNFAKINYESKHNINCWNQNEYLGFGLAAHSYYNNIRYSNTSNLQEYNKYFKNIDNNNIELEQKIIHEVQSNDKKMKEYMLLGLRKIEGIQISAFKTRFMNNPLDVYKEELDKLIKEDLIEIDVDNIKLTHKGIDFANLVWMEFI